MEKLLYLCDEFLNNKNMNEQQIDKLLNILQQHFNLFHANLICRAVQDDTISVNDFKFGVKAIQDSEECGQDEFVPQVFQNV